MQYIKLTQTDENPPLGARRQELKVIKLNLAYKEPNLPQLKSSGKNGEFPEGPSRNDSMECVWTEGNYFEGDTVTGN
ncbi:hypothetical protein TNCV_1216081 [Trichonephila clavipes]|nr:hypothetical protein TNCV_1216081 [Trichonephila clavipes]